jgi:hypothetical protein
LAKRPGFLAGALRALWAIEHFVRIRPHVERGTLNGSAPFAGVLAGAGALR